MSRCFAWIKQRRRVILAVGGVTFVLLFGYGYWQAESQYQLRCDCAEAEDAVATALIAIRDGDTKGLATVLYTDSIDWVVLTHSPRNERKMMAHTAKQYGLKSLTDKQIRDSLEIVPDFPESLSARILQYRTWDDAVRYNGAIEE